MNTQDFQELIWQQGRELYRDMPWRRDTRPYYVLVSEIMLQQTQVDRVIPKFEAFIAAFPTVKSLAAASLADVLTLWSGLGYNRRAKFLHEAAKKIQTEFSGVFPETLPALVSLPGVGVNTAGALLAYSFNQPAIFIETNVRTVYFYHFFETQATVTDAELREIVEETIDREHPREWYWAIMDYGSYLKRQGVGRNDKSRHYKKQSPLKGSVREVRGQILKVLASGDMSIAELQTALQADDRFPVALEGLRQDGLVSETGGQLHLAR
ncbi:MAG: A/G-specific adenine glycosylase [Candidatus Microsaccharimonas sp.]